MTNETKYLLVSNGAQILTAARRSGNGGTLVINAFDSILLSGASPFATGELDDNQRSGIFVSAEPEATGNVGNFNLNTGVLIVESGARISADNFGSGQGTTQNINVNSPTEIVEAQGWITDTDGNVVLVATAPTPPHSPLFKPTSCAALP
ncbi:hypothetical protein NUACC21_53150 [Scytonema sp. NUACC21]